MNTHKHHITHKTICLLVFVVLLFVACSANNSTTPNSGIPIVYTDSTFPVLVDEDVTYANGLGYNKANNVPLTATLKLDVYSPINNSTNRPVYMFIHGGGFQGGTKTKPEIVDMAHYYASRGWIFMSIDYRTVEELGTIAGGTPEDVKMFYTGFAPQEWLDFSLQNASSHGDIQTSVAMYAAQRDAKAALRWIVANASKYHINPDFITVGGASAGSITAIALGISNQEDFRDEISTAEDSTLSTTNLNETFTVKSMVYFWGSNVKLELLDSIYGLSRYDSQDPELFLAHGTNDSNPTTTFAEATELKSIYDSLGIYNELVPLEGAGHGAWNATVDGKGLSQLTFDFLVERQGLKVE
jgi:acetyl esterase/lipase